MGRAQQSFGSFFEKIFFYGCSRVNGMAVTRFPDGCRVLGKNRVVRVKTPCDWILSYGGMTAMLDTKTTSTDSFAYSKIEPHQIEEMVKHQVAGAKAGYIIWFRKSDDVIFVSSLLLHGLLSKRGSIKGKIEGSNYLGKSRDFKAQFLFGIN